MRPTLMLFRIACLAMFALLCSACGFHLRNALTLPAHLMPVRVVAPDPYSPLAETLADSMLRAGATPASSDPEQPATTLQIVSERWGNPPISIDQFGRAQAVELSRDYVAPPADSIGKASERELLARELRREMGQAILRRIGAALNVTQPNIDTHRKAGDAATAPAPSTH
jgi:LPS-assembly lipoprotein